MQILCLFRQCRKKLEVLQKQNLHVISINSLLVKLINYIDKISVYNKIYSQKIDFRFG